jgi:DHA2 family multidrug resistance protein
MLSEKDSVLEKPPHFDPNNILLCFYAARYAATDLLPNFVQEMLGYTATTSGMVFSPAGLCTMIEVPFVGFVLTRD